MSTDTLYILRANASRAVFADLDPVVLTADVIADDGTTIPAGTHGTVVGVWESGAEFEVEFSEPPGLATVLAGALRAERGSI